MEKDLFYLTKYLLNYMCDKFHERDIQSGINSYFSMICEFIYERSERGENTIQKNVQDEMLTPKSVTSELISKMIRDGLIIKKKDTIDKRKDNLYLTDKGKEFTLTNLKVERVIQENILSLLDNKHEIDTFFNLYSKLINKIKEEK